MDHEVGTITKKKTSSGCNGSMRGKSNRKRRSEGREYGNKK